MVEPIFRIEFSTTGEFILLLKQYFLVRWIKRRFHFRKGSFTKIGSWLLIGFIEKFTTLYSKKKYLKI